LERKLKLERDCAQANKAAAINKKSWQGHNKSNREEKSKEGKD
jgi:hypothetical protein